MMKTLERVNVLGVGVSAINMEQALDQMARWIVSRSHEYVCVCTVHGVMDCQRHADLKVIFNSGGMVTPDGMPLVWLGRRGHPLVARVYGPDLMLAELDRSVANGHRHFLYGGAPGVGEKLADRMKKRFPGLQIAGVMEPPFASLDELCTPEAAAEINASGADVVWVGIGSPKQEYWMARMRPLLQAPVLVGVGAAFDFHSGTVRQAPSWMQRSGLEWLFRLASDPRRLWRRYLVDNPWFLFAIVLQGMGLKRYELQQ